MMKDNTAAYFISHYREARSELHDIDVNLAI